MPYAHWTINNYNLGVKVAFLFQIFLVITVSKLDFLSSRSILKLDNNPWVPPIEDQLMLGVSHVIEYIRTGKQYSTYSSV